MAASNLTIRFRTLSFKLPLFTVRQFNVSSNALRYKRAIVRREERRRRVKFYIPKKKSTKSSKYLLVVLISGYYYSNTLSWVRCGIVHYRSAPNSQMVRQYSVYILDSIYCLLSYFDTPANNSLRISTCSMPHVCGPDCRAKSVVANSAVHHEMGAARC